METVRVAFVDVPRLLRDLSVGLLARDARVDVDAADIARSKLPDAVAAGEVEVLVAGPRFSDAGQICRLLVSYPRLKALVVLDEGRRAAFYELRPNLETQELSAEMLVGVVRSARARCEDQFRDGPSA